MFELNIFKPNQIEIEYQQVLVNVRTIDFTDVSIYSYFRISPIEGDILQLLTTTGIFCSHQVAFIYYFYILLQSFGTFLLLFVFQYSKERTPTIESLTPRYGLPGRNLIKFHSSTFIRGFETSVHLFT